jgi:hypothetical protein
MLVNILLCAVVYLGFAVWELNRRVLRLQGQIDPAFARAQKIRIRDSRRKWLYVTAILLALVIYAVNSLFGGWVTAIVSTPISVAMIFWASRIERREEDRFLESYYSPCKCGIPNCPGHEVKDGKAIVVGHPLTDKK